MFSADATLIALRESLEAFLLVGILAGMVVKMGQPTARRPLLWGAAVALVLSVLAGMLIDRFIREAFEAGLNAAKFEGVASLVAVAILTYMVVWMYRQTLEMVNEMRKRAHGAIAAGRPSLFFVFSFVAVAREGIETVLFFAASAAHVSSLDLVFSALVGIAASGILAFLVFGGIVRLDLKGFFATTGILLILFAGGLLMTSIHEFAEVGWIPETTTVWNLGSLVGEESAVGAFLHATFGYREAPSLLEAGSWLVYVVGFGVWYVRGLLHLGRAGPTPAAPA